MYTQIYIFYRCVYIYIYIRPYKYLYIYTYSTYIYIYIYLFYLYIYIYIYTYFTYTYICIYLFYLYIYMYILILLIYICIYLFYLYIYLFYFYIYILWWRNTTPSYICRVMEKGGGIRRPSADYSSNQELAVERKAVSLQPFHINTKWHGHEIIPLSISHVCVSGERQTCDHDWCGGINSQKANKW